MFGGYGLYADEPICAFVNREQLFFKVDKLTLSQFEEAGSEPFTYAGKDGKPISISYWRSPTLDPNEIIVWATL